MKSAVFAKPNLKMFLLAALLIALVQNFVVNGRSEATLVHARNSRGGPGSAVNLQQLLAQAETSPNAELYARISRCYEKQHDLKKALLYLRKAELLSQFEDAND
jgi:hypothetical protein